ncbi:MAG: hypothetical protein INF43_03490 [Alphaproteobacteria bacterium]|nr:hypothetical protein [Alphaproteobacteria bacterium]
MRFTPLLGLAMVVATPLACLANDPPPTATRLLQGIPLVAQLADLRCPTEHRFEVVMASLLRGGWRQHGPAKHGPVVNRHPTVLSPWQRGEVRLWVQHGNGAACVILESNENRRE